MKYTKADAWEDYQMTAGADEGAADSGTDGLAESPEGRGLVPRMVINGVTVTPVFLLMQQIDDLGFYIDSFEDDHPDLPIWLTRYQALWKEFLNQRKI